MVDRKKGKEHDLQVGDVVLSKQKKKNKLTPAYNPEPVTVTNVKGSMVTVQGEKSSTRDGSTFKRLLFDPTSYEGDNESSEDEDELEEDVPREGDSHLGTQVGADQEVDASAEPVMPRRSGRAPKKPAWMADYQ